LITGYEPSACFGHIVSKCVSLSVSVSLYLGTTINKHQIMQQKTNHNRTAFILFPGHLK